jgi:hypothetical protein
MGRIVGISVIVGLAVASFWVGLCVLAPQTFVQLVRLNLVTVSAPASILGQRHPQTFYELILLNGVTYGLAGGLLALIARAAHWTPGRRVGGMRAH